MTQNEYALIVAGGQGTRFGSSIPKQFVLLQGKPVLLHTIEAFLRYRKEMPVVVVLPETDIPLWQALISKHKLSGPVVIQAGGQTRFQSVKKGLELIPDEALVAIHDGVRPLVTRHVIATSFKVASVQQSAVAAVPLRESIREVTSNAGSSQSETRAVDRSRFRLIQTPQTFHARSIKRAYQVAEDPSLTDDSSVAEKAGITIHLFDGDYRNIKITNREDLAIAELLMNTSGGL